MANPLFSSEAQSSTTNTEQDNMSQHDTLANPTSQLTITPPPPPTSPTHPRAHLLSIAAELRNHIYALVAISSTPITVFRDKDGHGLRSSFSHLQSLPPLAHTCQQISREMVPMYWSQNTFELFNFQQPININTFPVAKHILNDWKHLIGYHNFLKINRFSLTLHHHSFPITLHAENLGTEHPAIRIESFAIFTFQGEETVLPVRGCHCVYRASATGSDTKAGQINSLLQEFCLRAAEFEYSDEGRCVNPKCLERREVRVRRG